MRLMNPFFMKQLHILVARLSERSDSEDITVYIDTMVTCILVARLS